MARSGTQSRAKADKTSKTDSPESTVTETPTEINEESTVTDTAEATAEPTTATEASAEIDYSEFTSAAQSAVDSRDPSTGTIPVEQIELTKVAYKNLPSTKARNQGRKILQEWLKDAVGNLDVVKGKAVMELSDTLSAPQPAAEKAPKAARLPADPAAAFRVRLTAAHLAYSLVAGDAPEGVDGDKVLAEVGEIVDGLNDSAVEYFAWLKLGKDTEVPEPEADQAVKMAAKMALGKAVRASSGSTRAATVSSGPRGNTLAHIKEIVAQHPAGTFLLVRELAQPASSEYPEGNVSPGAISARLFPAEGKAVHADLLAIVTPTQNENGKNGVTVL